MKTNPADMIRSINRELDKEEAMYFNKAVEQRAQTVKEWLNFEQRCKVTEVCREAKGQWARTMVVQKRLDLNRLDAAAAVLAFNLYLI